MSIESLEAPAFGELGLSPEVLRALETIGYETPSPIQARSIPVVLEGKDLVAQAQTGTGKTGAFALPLLSMIEPKDPVTQVLVLVPTRELAIQVAEAFQKYAAHIQGFHVMPIYGGAGYGGQLHQLKRGVHVVVATPGRLCDHLRRGTLKLEELECLVIDEADEMLRMGFIDEVEWIIEQTPAKRQILLFSATMPDPIRRIAQRHLHEPEEVTIKAKTSTASTIRQRYWMVSGIHKLDALTRILEAEDFDAMIIFVRTKSATIELSDRLEARGFRSAPLSGDVTQSQREATVEKLRSGDLDILVATDVAARGLDVSRISHIVNYDIPYDTDSYVHRIGRTGRAGRTGEAILFVAPRERRLLLAIERATRQKIELMELPTTEAINDLRVAKFKQRITDTLAVEDLGFYYQLVEEYRNEHNIPEREIAAALARMLQGDVPLLLEKNNPAPAPVFANREESPRREWKDAPPRRDREWKDSAPPRRSERRDDGTARELYRVEVGRIHGVKPGQIVGAVTNEGGLNGKELGRIELYDDFSTIELPVGVSRNALASIRKAYVCGRPLLIESHDGPLPAKSEERGRLFDRDRGPNPSFKKKFFKDDKKPGGKKFFKKDRY